jgi:hypothetical protein
VKSQPKSTNSKTWSSLVALSLLAASLSSFAQVNAQGFKDGKTTTVGKTTETFHGQSQNRQWDAIPLAANTAATTTATATPAVVPPASSKQAAPELVALCGPKQINHSGAGWKVTPSILTLKAGQDVLPLTLTVTNGNGTDPATKLRGLRIILNGRKLLSEADFKGKDSLSLNMAGFLSSGDTQLEIQTFGASTAFASWVLTTPKIKVSDIKPETAGPGDTVTISGKNLPTDKSAYQVLVGKQSAEVKNVSAKALDFIMPQGVESGKVAVTLYIAGVKCDPLYIKSKVIPELSGTNMVECPPSTAMIIYGKGFSKTASDNVVTFNGMAAQVNSATDTQMEVVVPSGLQFPQYDVEVKLKSKGVDAKNTLKVNVTVRVIPKGEFLGPGMQPTN